MIPESKKIQNRESDKYWKVEQMANVKGLPCNEELSDDFADGGDKRAW